MFVDLIALVGLSLITYAFLDFIGINLLYVAKLLNPKVRKRRREVRGFINSVINERLNRVLKVLGIETSNLGVRAPKVILNLRESRRPGGKYFRCFRLIIVDVPFNKPKDVLPVLDHELVHYIQDVLSMKGPKWYLEGMATYVELVLHNKIKGYKNELKSFLKLRAFHQN